MTARDKSDTGYEAKAHPGCAQPGCAEGPFPTEEEQRQHTLTVLTAAMHERRLTRLNGAMRAACEQLVAHLYRLEGYYADPIAPEDLRRVAEQEAAPADPWQLRRADNRIGGFFQKLVCILPQNAYADRASPTEPLAPLLSLFFQPRSAIGLCVSEFIVPTWDGHQPFALLRETLFENLAKTRFARLNTYQGSDAEAAAAYLAGTPFLDLLAVEVPSRVSHLSPGRGL